MENNTLPSQQEPQAAQEQAAEKNNRQDVSHRSDVIDVGSMLHNYLRHWWLFVISIALCGGAAVFYVKKKSPVFLMEGMMMVNQQEDGGMAQVGAMSALMNSMGFGSTTGANPENEQLKMMSHTMLQKVVTALHLNTSYWKDNGFFKRRYNYYKNEPLNITIPAAVLDTLSASTMFSLEGTARGPWRLKVKQAKKTVIDTEVKRLPYDAKTPFGTFHIEATEHFPKSGEFNLCAVYMSNQDAVDWLAESVAVSYVSNKTDALVIDTEDVVIERGIDIVNTLMDIYNEGRDADRIAYNKSVLDFIDNRLLSLYHELEGSETKIEQYKKKHKVVSAEAEAEYLFTRKGAMDESAVQLQVGMQIMEMIRQMLSSPETKYSLIPFSGNGMQEMGEAYSNLIEGYNSLIMQRMTLASSAKSGNSALTMLDEQIEAMRRNILSTVNREMQSARINYKTLMSEQGKSDSRMNEIPSMEHELITLYRDREVQNAIYGFLLQKREETQIALSQSQPVGKIIDRAYANSKPVAPKSMLIYGLAMFFGLGAPITFLQIRRRKK